MSNTNSTTTTLPRHRGTHTYVLRACDGTTYRATARIVKRLGSDWLLRVTWLDDGLTDAATAQWDPARQRFIPAHADHQPTD